MNESNFLHLKKPLESERYGINIVNANTDAIDSAIQTVTGRINTTDETLQTAKNELQSHIGSSQVHFTPGERVKLSNIESNAQRNTVTGVKGSQESSYRTGNINISPADVGALPASIKGAANGVAELNNDAKVPVTQLPDASTTYQGIVQLTDSVTSDSVSTAATPNSVKVAYDKAVGVEATLTAGLSAEIQRAKAAERASADAISAEAGRAAAAESAIESAIQANQPIWEDKYTRNEIDNKFSTLETAIDWKESVDTFSAITAMYPNPEDGWTVNVRDTDYTYRWSGTEWVAISANAIPKATQAVDGLLSKEDKTNYDDANAKKHSHNNKAVLDGVTSSLVTAWNNASEHTTEKANPHQVTYTQTGAAPANHASSSDAYGRASAVNYGHVKLSDVTDSTSGTGAATAATPLAVKKVYDELANSKADTGHMHTNMNCINLSGQTVDADSYTLSSGTPHYQRYTVLTSAGAANITHIPVTGQPFLLTAELIRFASPNDYVTKQTFVTNAQKSTYTRWCTSGTWSNWLPDARFSDSPVNGQVLVAGSAGGTIKPSGFTLGASVPADAKFTDTNTWRGIQNNLTSDSTEDSLSAAQGKALKALADGKAALSHTHNYAGSSSPGGAANTALKWNAARTISLTGAVTGSVTMDGSGNVSMATSEGENISFKKMGEVTGTTNWNTVKTPGCYKVQCRSGWEHESCPGSYNRNIYAFGLLIVFVSSVTEENRTVQIYFPHQADTPLSSTILTRMLNQGTWTRWDPIYKGISKSDISDFPASLKNPNALTIQANGTTIGTYDGSSAKTCNLTPANIGAAPASHGSHIPDTCAGISDWNNAVKTGWYMANNAANAPITGNVWFYGEVIAHNTEYVRQILYRFSGGTDVYNPINNKYERVKNNGAWGAWYDTSVRTAVPSNAKFTDTVYTHPSASGNKHIPSGGSSGQILRWSADGTAVWGSDNNTTYSPATTSANGLMSAADKTKLNGIAAGAQVNTVTGIKGNAETAYRTGNVNLTPANIGAAASNHTHNYAATSHTHNYAGSSSAGGIATKALQDSDGNQLNTTYVKKGCTWNDLKGI